MKALILAAALAVLAAPAFAQGAAVPPPPPPPGDMHGVMMPPGAEKMSLEEVKAKMTEHKAHRDAMEAKIAEGRKSMDAHRNDCYTKMQAAGSKEELKSIGEKCREEGKKMHEARRAEMGERKGEFKAKRQEMRDAAKAKTE